jgi:4-coumarate--CoA ligase
MSEIVSSEPAPFIPDDLTVPQFFFDSDHQLKATRPYGVPFFVDDVTGRAVDSREVSNVDALILSGTNPTEARKRVDGLANGLSRRWDISEYRRKFMCHRAGS